MPIYAYRCDACGHSQDILQKLSDPLLSICPACGAEAFSKQLTSAGFQLKGSGWYVTDFRDGNKAAKRGDEKAAEGDAKADVKPDAKVDGKSDGKSDGKTDAKSDSPAAPPAPTSAPKPAPAAAPASPSTSPPPPPSDSR